MIATEIPALIEMSEAINASNRIIARVPESIVSPLPTF